MPRSVPTPRTGSPVLSHPDSDCRRRNSTGSASVFCGRSRAVTAGGEFHPAPKTAFTIVPKIRKSSRSQRCISPGRRIKKSRTPCMTRENEFAPDGRKRLANLPSPIKDLHTSRSAKPFPQRSCTSHTNFLQKQAEGVPSSRKKAGRRAGGSGILRPPEPRIPSRIS